MKYEILLREEIPSLLLLLFWFVLVVIFSPNTAHLEKWDVIWETILRVVLILEPEERNCHWFKVSLIYANCNDCSMIPYKKKK